jgi:hypothetical protein
MIGFRDTKRRGNPPAWLVGAADLTCVDAGPGGTVWSLAPAALVPTAVPWLDIGDGYQVGGSLEQADILSLTRTPLEYVTEPATDSKGRAWPAPRIVMEDGSRAFPVAYGDDWMPALTPEQARAEAICQEALRTPNTPVPVACQWAAELIGLTVRLPPTAIQRLRCMDAALLVQVLSVATGQTAQKV